MLQHDSNSSHNNNQDTADQLSILNTTKACSTLSSRCQALKYFDLSLNVFPIVLNQDANKHPKKRNGKVVYDKNGNPVPLFNEKNPSYFDETGQPQLSSINEPLSIETVLAYLDSDRPYGIGYSVPGESDIATIDLDRKHFISQEECDRCLEKTKYYLFFRGLNPHIEKTRSGGYHIVVRLHPSDIENKFTNFICEGFELAEGSSHHGEIMRSFVVCAPTPGYTVINEGIAASSPQLSELGIISARDSNRKLAAVKTALPKELSLEGEGQKIELETLDREDEKLLAKLRSGSPVELEKLLGKKSTLFLNSKQENIDRSEETVKLYYDAHGAANFCRDFDIPFAGDPDEIVTRGSELNDTYHKIGSILNPRKVKAKELAVSPLEWHKGKKHFLYHVAVASGTIKGTASFKRFNKEKWQRYQNFTPDEIINTQYLHDRTLTCNEKQLINKWLKDNDLVFIRSGLGTGKTDAFTEYLKDKYGVLLVGYRNTLLTQIRDRANKLIEKFRGELGKMHHLQTDDAKDLIKDLKSLLALCLDSLHHFCDEDFNDRIVVIDEAVSVILHLMTSSTLAKFARKNGDDFWAKGRALYLAKFAQLIGKASKIIVLDGHLNNATCRYFEDLRAKAGKPKSSIKVLNTYQAAKLNIKVIEASNEEGQPSLYDNTPLSRHIVSVLKSRIVGQKRKTIAIVADSAAKLRSLETKLTGLGYNCLLVWSGTTGESKKAKFPLQKEFVENSTKFIDEHPEIDAILMSPTVESGIDISSIDRFLCGFAFFVGLLSTNTYLQFLRRVRDCSDWFIHIVPQCNLYDKRSLSEWHEAGIYYIDQTLSGDDLKVAKEQAIVNTGSVKNTISWRYHSELLDSLMFERDNSKECLVYALKEAGHDVEIVQLSSDKAIKEELDSITDERLMMQSRQLCSAQKITFEEAQSLMGKIDHSDDEQLQIDRALLVHDLGDDENCDLINENFVFDYLKSRKKGDLEKMKRRIYLKRKEESKLMNQKNLTKDISNQLFDIERARLGLKQVNKQTKICAYDLPIDKIKLTALSDLGIVDLEDGNWHDAESPKLLAFKQKICSSSVLLGIFGNGIKSEKQTAWVPAFHDLLKEYGFRIESTQSRANGRKRQYQYFLSEPGEAEKNAVRVKEKNADKLAVLEAQWIQSEKLEACVNKAFENRLQAIGAKPSDRDFDPKALLIDNVPHHYEWASPVDCDGIDFMHKEAIEAKDIDKLKAVIDFVKALWEEVKPEETIAISKTGYTITTVKHEVFEDETERGSRLAMERSLAYMASNQNEDDTEDDSNFLNEVA